MKIPPSCTETCDTMRVLLAGYGTRGDVQPMIALGTRLRAEGHEVVIGASAVFGAWARGHGLEFHAIGGDIEAHIRGFGWDLTRRPTLLMGRLLDTLRDEIDLSFDQTIEAARGADFVRTAPRRRRTRGFGQARVTTDRAGVTLRAHGALPGCRSQYVELDGL